MKNVVKIYRTIIGIFTVYAVLLFVMALVKAPTQSEAYIGSFDTNSFNENWILDDPDGSENVTLPYSKFEEKGSKAILQNTLPDYVADGMRFNIRASTQDIFIYIDDELRGSYATQNFKRMAESLPSAYLFVDLTREDAGKKIEVYYTIKASKLNHFNSAHIAYGNNTWFEIIFSNVPVVIAAGLVIVIASLVLLIAVFVRRKIDIGYSVSYLSQTMIVAGMWILSESAMRQIIFSRPSQSYIFAYLFVELISCMILFYIDEVQHRTYNKIFRVLEMIVTLQMIVLAILNFTRIVEYYSTLICTHIVMIAGILLIMVTLGIDVHKKRFHKYRFSGYGLSAFLICCLLELIGFYFLNMYTLGVFMCIGLLILLAATVIQTVYDQVDNQKKIRERIQQMGLASIESMAKTIDAKDKYTGGHSERVAHYGSVLARALPDSYNLSEEAFESLEYSGLIHDIGKIGIPDYILNKPSSLTDEEFAIMKSHTTIGAKIIESLDYVMCGVGEGVKYHHERYDGKGYPEGLSGEQIPLCARILCLADSYDAMTSNRVYRKRLTKEQVREEIVKNRGKQFDPELTDIFLQLFDAGKLGNESELKL